MRQHVGIKYDLDHITNMNEFPNCKYFCGVYVKCMNKNQCAIFVVVLVLFIHFESHVILVCDLC